MQPVGCQESSDETQEPPQLAASLGGQAGLLSLLFERRVVRLKRGVVLLLLTTAESIFVAQRARVTELAARYKLPAMYCYSANVVDSAGLMAYDVSYSDVIRRAAS
jgi:hypothetical protein